MTDTWTSADDLPSTETDAGPAERDPLRNVLRVFVAFLALAAIALLVVLVVVAGRDDSVTKGPKQGSAAGYPIRDAKSIFGPSADDPFDAPLGVGFSPGGNLWVSDTGKGRIVIMTTGGRVQHVIADRTGAGAVSSPYGIAADPQRERMYVADWTQGAVLAFSESGRFLESYPAPGQDRAIFGDGGFTPYDVKLVGSRVVASSNDGLYFFDSTGRVVARWGSGKRGGRVGDLNFPDAFEVDNANKRVYVTDTLNRRVVALDLDGNVLWVSGSPDTAGTITGFWQLPRGITMGPDGTILVVDTFRFNEVGVGKGYIVALSKDGDLVSEFGRAGDEEDSMSFPDKIAAGPGGQYAVADRAHNRILLFHLTDLPAPERAEATLYEKTFSRPNGLNMEHTISSGRG